MLMDLNEYLRISLDRTRQEMVSLSRELDLVRRYLSIFKVRMGSRLDFEIMDHTGLPGIPFPPLVIQPLVENALKYGLEPQVDGGKLPLTAGCRAGTWSYRYQTPGPGWIVLGYRPGSA